jgi:hypothetical protein
VISVIQIQYVLCDVSSLVTFKTVLPCKGQTRNKSISGVVKMALFRKRKAYGQLVAWPQFLVRKPTLKYVSGFDVFCSIRVSTTSLTAWNVNYVINLPFVLMSVYQITFIFLLLLLTLRREQLRRMKCHENTSHQVRALRAAHCVS